MHKSVLLKEVIENLNIKDNEIVIDCTVGNAGHIKGILETGVSNLTVLAIDADETAITKAKENLKIFQNSHHIYFEKTYFDSLADMMKKNSIDEADKIIFDLGLRSDQIDNPDRGFSFLQDGPLNMSFDQGAELNAETVVNEWKEENLADIIYGFADEKFSRRIAKAIATAREENRITTTKQLAEIIEKSVPVFYRRSKIHPATKTFQAIRIAVNQEIIRLQKTLPYAFEKLKNNGMIAVITFHSTEDRIVKNFFRELTRQNKSTLINKKPIKPSESEISDNPRSRSAKLRIIKKII